MAQRIDTRLEHLLKLKKQAYTDVARYVQKRWPEGAHISYEQKGVRKTGKVCGHDIDAQVVVVADALRRKVRISYSHIHEQRARRG